MRNRSPLHWHTLAVWARLSIQMEECPGRRACSRWTTVGCILVAMSYAIASLGAYAILYEAPDLHTRAGRHLLAGGLAIATLSGVEMIVALLPLRRGERWAFWVAILPLVSLVVPMMVVDATHVAPEHRLATLVPFIVGLALAAIGLFLTATNTGTHALGVQCRK